MADISQNCASPIIILPHQLSQASSNKPDPCTEEDSHLGANLILNQNILSIFLVDMDRILKILIGGLEMIFIQTENGPQFVWTFIPLIMIHRFVFYFLLKINGQIICC